MKGTTNIPVVNVILRRGDKILFVLRSNTGWMDGHYALPAGHVDPGETFREAACREVLEEVGINLKSDQLDHKITFHEMRQGEVRVGIYFEAQNWSGEPYNAEPSKHGEIAWFDLHDLPENVINTTRNKLQLIEDDVTYMEYGW